MRLIQPFPQQTQPTKECNKASGNLARLLSEDFENTSSNITYKKEKNSRLSPLTAKEQRDSYLKVQSGEVPPLYGFRKQLPEAPKSKLTFQYLDLFTFTNPKAELTMD